ncbi:hypothetical protein K525DRAFT_252459 [Schizophyllum commune Loenen D]|nr:hypothetical protein K525DRAFT_252459 [Schizophyllum commune Loenen D]
MPQDAPISVLPQELLPEIFLRYVAAYEMSVWSRMALRHLALVCVDWRVAAFSAPQLWTYIQWDRLIKYPDLLAQRLERTGNVPLHIDATWLFSRSDDVASQLLALLRDRAAQWKRVRLTAVSTDLATLANVGFPFLEDLLVGLKLPSSSASLAFLAHAPRLRSLEISTQVDLGVFQGPNEGYHIAFHLNALRYCASSLEELKLGMQASRDASTARPRPVTTVILPSLNHITLSENTHLVLSFISAPKLAHIALSGSQEGGNDGDVFLSLLGFLNNAGTDLVTALDMRNITGTSAMNLVRCIERLPRLRSLTFVECIEGATGELMGATTLQALTRTTLLPELSDLHVCYTHRVPATTIDAWYEFAEWRAEERICEGDVIQAPKSLYANVSRGKLRC